MVRVNLKYFNHHNKKFRYIAGDKLIIDKIFNCKLTKLFSNELDNAVSKDQFCKDFAASVQKVYEFYFNRILENIHFKNYIN